MWRFRRVLFVIGLLGVGSLGAVLYLFSRTTLPPDDYDALKQTTYVCTAEITGPGACNAENATAALVPPGEDRIKISYGDLPQPLIQAVVATEDQDFFTHRGIDPRGISRAAVQTLLGRRVSQGGSTITQQYVKIAFDDKDRNLTRKLREALRAIKLEQDLTKQCADKPAELAGRTPTQCAKELILERYLNRAYFGRGASGVQAAAHAYFNTDVSQLSVAQAAYIAGVIRNPAAAEPDTHPAEALRRRTVSITRMEEMGFITSDQAKTANEEAFAPQKRQDREGLGAVKSSEYGSEYFVEEVRQQLEEIYNGDYRGKGLRVYTTLNRDLQQAAYESVYVENKATLSGLKEMGPTWLDPNNPNDPAAAIVSLDENGRVVTMLGGSDFKKSEFNLATSSGGNARQPGSTFKPLDLTTAVENNISLKSLYPAVPGVTKIGGGCVDEKKKPWEVSGGANPTTHYRDLVDALTVSANVVFAELVVDITPEKLQQTARSMGIKAPLSVSAGGGKPFVPCSLALGGVGVPVIDMASAYSTLERGGKQLDPILIDRIEDVNGKVVCAAPVDGVCSGDKPIQDRTVGAKTPIRESTAAQVTYAMTQVVAKGTGKRAALPDRAMAGKTGTSQENRDAWFAGFTCGMTTVVWMGYPDSERPMYDFRKPLPASGKVPVDKNGDPVDDPGWHNVEGANFPSYFWNTYMKKVMAAKVGDQSVLPPCKTLPHVSQDFTGEQRGAELSTTTLPTCGFDLNGDGTADTAGDGGNGNPQDQGNGGQCQPAGDQGGGSTTSVTRFPFPDSTRPGGPSTFTVPTFTITTPSTRGQGSSTTPTTGRGGGGSTTSTTNRGGQTPNTG